MRKQWFWCAFLVARYSAAGRPAQGAKTACPRRAPSSPAGDLTLGPVLLPRLDAGGNRSKPGLMSLTAQQAGLRLGTTEASALVELCMAKMSRAAGRHHRPPARSSWW